MNPLPVQRPIPIWLGGGSSTVVLRRIARLADGWCPNFSPDKEGSGMLEKVRGYMREAGRDPAELGLEGRIRIAGKQPEDWLGEAKAWEELGATHLVVETRRGGLAGLQDHLRAITQLLQTVKEVAG